MDIGNLYRYLLLCETMNITSAAEQSYMTRQAFADSIVKMESELGVKLLLRQKRGFELTPAGTELMLFLKNWLPEWQKELNTLSNIEKAEHSTIKMGVAFSNLATRFLDRIINYESINGNTAVEYNEYPPDECFALLQQHALDIVCILNSGEQPGCLKKRLPETGTEAMLMMHESHPLAKKDIIHTEDLKGVNMVLVSKNMKPDPKLDEYALPYGAIPIYVPVRNEPYTLRIMKERKAVGLSSGRRANRFEDEGFVRRPIPDYPLDLSCYVYYREDASDDLKEFIDYFTR